MQQRFKEKVREGKKKIPHAMSCVRELLNP